MALFLSHESAADFWRLVYPADKAPGMPADAIELDRRPLSVSGLRQTVPTWLDGTFLSLEQGRLHVLVADARMRCGSRSVKSHIWKRPLPNGAFYRLSEDLCIASPPFVFLQLASTCTVAELAAYGYELCGRYAFDPRQERGTHRRKIPLATSSQLAAFLEGAAGAPGIVRAKQALAHIAENSESPMETATHLLLSLPYRYGGYGIGGLSLNREITLSEDAALVARRRKCRADILLEGAKLDIEFAGKFDHTGDDALESDRRRTNALASMGFEVIELTSGQVRDWRTFEQVALRIAAAAGKRIRNENRGLLAERMSLRQALHDWNDASGRKRPEGLL